MNLFLRSAAAAAVLVVVAGCSTTNSRITDHQSDFNSWPAAVQEKIRAGQIEIGYTQPMVEIALGVPDRQSSRTTAQGTADVWVYFDKGPKFSVGVGMGSSRGHSSYGGGVVVGDNGFVDDEMMRVIFEHGRVVAIEMRQK